MKNEEIFDYARGLSAPYWIQEIRTKKGKLLASFSVPVQLSYFVVFALVLIAMLTVLRPIMNLLYVVGRGLIYILYWYVPNKLAKLYSESDIDGKSMLHYTKDIFLFWIDFGLNRKSMYQGERVALPREIKFEKTQL